MSWLCVGLDHRYLAASASDARHLSLLSKSKGFGAADGPDILWMGKICDEPCASTRDSISQVSELNDTFTPTNLKRRVTPANSR